MNFFRYKGFPVLLVIICIAMISFVPGKKKKGKASKKPAIAVRHIEAARDSFENPYYIIIDKSDYELKVYDDEGWYATYPIVFGSNDLTDKKMEGDKLTPEGNFRIIIKKIHPKWGPELLLNFPNETTMVKFNENKAKGLIPKSARPGGGIAIHATRPQEEWTIDHFYNWTDGCISVKYTEMKDLFSYIPIGTPVTIRK